MKNMELKILSKILKFINEIVRMEKEAQRIDNHETYAVVGNHDCFYASSENLKDTALGNLLASGLVKLLDRVSLMNGLYEFVGWHFDKDLPVVDKRKRENQNIDRPCFL